MDVVLRIILVYLSVMVIAATIAYHANQLGRQIGKRKMSILHLRPRYTSILITTVTGAAIAVITLTVFAFLSQPVRELLVGVEKLRKEEAALRLQVDSLSRSLEEGRFVWKIDEPIVHMTIPSGLPYDRTKAALTNLLAEASTKTILKNNEIAKSKGDQPLNAGDVMVDYDSTQLDHLVETLSFGKGVKGLKVVARQNCLYREPAPVRMESWSVNLVFKEGAVVAQKEMARDGSLIDFLQFIEDVRKAAIQKGMRPIAGDLGGGLTTEEFDKLQEKIKKQEGKFILRAVANRDLYETSSLDVTVELHPLEQNQEEYYW